jgi:hypothetical protein
MCHPAGPIQHGIGCIFQLAQSRQRQRRGDRISYYDACIGECADSQLRAERLHDLPALDREWGAAINVTDTNTDAGK